MFLNKMFFPPSRVLPTPDSRLLSPDSCLPTPDSRLLTPDSRLLTPDSRLLTPDSRLDQSFIRKTIIPLLTHYNMIKYGDVQQGGSGFDLGGKLFIGAAGAETARRMVVAEYKTDGILFQGFAENDPGIGHRAGYAPFADHFQLLDFIGTVQV